MAKSVFLGLKKDDQNGYLISTEIRNERGFVIGQVDTKLPPVSDILAINDQLKELYKSFVRLTHIRRNLQITPNNKEELKPQITRKKINLDTSLNTWLNSPEMIRLLNVIRHNIHKSEEIQFFIDIQDQNLTECEKLELRKLRDLPLHFWREIFQSYENIGLAYSLPLREVEKIKIEQPKVLVIIGDSVTGIWYCFYLLRIAKLLNTRYFRLLGFYFHTLNIPNKLDLDEDWKIIQKYFSNPKRLLERSFQQIYDEILENTPHFMIVSGHSYTESNGQAFFTLNNDETITIYNLRQALREAVKKGLQLVIFNSCDGSGIVKQLEDIGIPNIIFMTEALPDKVAPVFLEGFLKAFLDLEFNCSVSIALQKAIVKIAAFEEEFPGVSLIPKLYVNPAFPILRGHEFNVTPIVDIQPPLENTQSKISVKILVKILIVLLISFFGFGMGTLYFLKSHPKENPNNQLSIPTKEINKPKSPNP